MTRLPKALLLAVLALAVNVARAQDLAPIGAQAAAPDAGPVDETPTRWLVELSSAPVADGGALATTRADKAAFRAAAAKAGVSFEERYAFDTLFNGVSVAVAPGQLDKLAKLSGVKAIWPVTVVRVPETAPSEPDLFTAVTMTGADVAGSELGLTGRGVKVAVMDTGVDLQHPAFLNDDGSSRVVAGWDFVGDAYNADATSPAYDPVPRPDPVPDDCNGHGTHVAGIVGARAVPSMNGPAGVAPGVTYGAYRVFGCAGSTESDIMLAAMERVLADGMDVLNMSIGSGYQWPQYPTAQAASRLVNHGVTVVASIGNDGAAGLWAAGAPGVGDKVIGVASFDNVGIVLPVFRISPDGRVVGYTAATGAPPAPKSGTAAMARTGTTTSAADACSPLAAGSLAGKVALVRRGTCSFYVKASNAQAAGAVGVVLYNNTSGLVNPTVAGSPAVTIPVVSITAADGAVVNGRLAAGPVDLTWTAEIGSFPNATGGLVSSFSSYGLSPDLTLKPDLGAPGGYVWSTFPLEKGGYASLSGTSMSSPHVAGAAALLLEARPHTPAQAVRGLLQNTAVPAPWFGNPGLGFLEGTWRQGAGMIRVDAAATATARVEPSKLSLGESQAGPQTVALTVTNEGAADVTFALSSTPSLAVRGTFAPGFYAAFATASFPGGDGVTVPAGSSAVVSATITAPTAPDRALYGGWIVLTPVGGGQVLRVPYAGFVGDYQSIQVLAPTANGFPWLAGVVGSSYRRQDAGAVYTLAGGDVPYFLLHLDHPSRALRIRIQDAATGRSWFDAYREEYLPRNSTAAGFFAFPWDGTTTNGGGKPTAVPNGTYVAVVTVRKALGGDADVETWTSPAFTIARP